MGNFCFLALISYYFPLLVMRVNLKQILKFILNALFILSQNMKFLSSNWKLLYLNLTNNNVDKYDCLDFVKINQLIFVFSNMTIDILWWKWSDDVSPNMLKVYRSMMSTFESACPFWFLILRWKDPLIRQVKIRS